MQWGYVAVEGEAGIWPPAWERLPIAALDAPRRGESGVGTAKEEGRAVGRYA